MRDFETFKARMELCARNNPPTWDDVIHAVLQVADNIIQEPRHGKGPLTPRELVDRLRNELGRR